MQNVSIIREKQEVLYKLINISIIWRYNHPQTILLQIKMRSLISVASTQQLSRNHAKKEQSFTVKGNKAFFSNLEEKYKKLEQENLSLKLEVSQLKEKLSKYSEETKGFWNENIIEGPHERLKTEEKFAYEGLLNLIKQNPEQVRFTMIDSVLQSVGDFGTERVNFIDNYKFEIIIFFLIQTINFLPFVIII